MKWRTNNFGGSIWSFAQGVEPADEHPRAFGDAECRNATGSGLRSPERGCAGGGGGAAIGKLHRVQRDPAVIAGGVQIG